MAKQKRGKPYLSVVDKTVHQNDVPYGTPLVERKVLDPYSDSGGLINVSVPVRGGKKDGKQDPRRGSPLDYMFARRQITQHQFTVGQYVQDLFELSSNIRSPDYSKPPASGGSDERIPISEHQLKAYNRLKHAYRRLGTVSFELVRDIVADRQNIEQVTRAREPAPTQRKRDAWGERFRTVLDELATMFGFQGEAPRRKSIRDKHSDAARHVANSLKEAA